MSAGKPRMCSWCISLRASPEHPAIKRGWKRDECREARRGRSGCHDCKNFRWLYGEDVSNQLMKAAHSKERLEMQREHVALHSSLAPAIVMALPSSWQSSSSMPVTTPVFQPPPPASLQPLTYQRHFGSTKPARYPDPVQDTVHERPTAACFLMVLSPAESRQSRHQATASCLASVAHIGPFSRGGPTPKVMQWNQYHEVCDRSTNWQPAGVQTYVASSVQAPGGAHIPPLLPPLPRALLLPPPLVAMAMPSTEEMEDIWHLAAGKPPPSASTPPRFYLPPAPVCCHPASTPQTVAPDPGLVQPPPIQHAPEALLSQFHATDEDSDDGRVDTGHNSDHGEDTGQDADLDEGGRGQADAAKRHGHQEGLQLLPSAQRAGRASSGYKGVHKMRNGKFWAWESQGRKTTGFLSAEEAALAFAQFKARARGRTDVRS
jgi:hypothetical protein